MMKLLVNNVAFGYQGGAEMRIRSLLEELRMRDDIEKVFFISTDSEYKDEKLEVYRCFSPFQTYHKAKELMENEKIDIVQLHNAPDIGPVSLLAAKEGGVKTVFFVHDFWGIGCARLFLTQGDAARTFGICKPPLDRLKCFRCVGNASLNKALHNKDMLLKWADKVVFSGETIRDIYVAEGFDKEKTVIVPPWIQPYYLNIEHKIVPPLIPTIMFPHQPFEYKGLWQVVEALPAVIQEIGKVKIKIVSGGGGLDKIIEQAEQLGVKEFIEFVGFRQHLSMVAEYCNSNVVVMPSMWPEIASLYIYEALALGIPVIASRVGTIPEYFEGRIPLFDVGDIETLTKHLISILKNRSYEIGKNNQQYIRDNFNPIRAADDMIALYKNLLSK